MDAKTLRRFDAKVVKTDTCWLWTGALSTKRAQLVADGRVQYAHRLSYEHYVGPIPEGLQIDHLCRVPHCVNPAHLEPVTPRENTRRGNATPAVVARTGKCMRGHPFKLGTYRTDKRGYRECLKCRAERARRYRAAGKARAS